MLATIRTILLADPTISGAVGTDVYVGFAAQGELQPYILLEELYRTPNDCKDFVSVMDSYVFIVTAVATQYSMVETLLNAVRTALVSYKDEDFKGISFNSLEERYDGTQDYFVKSHSYKSLITIP